MELKKIIIQEQERSFNAEVWHITSLDVNIAKILPRSLCLNVITNQRIIVNIGMWLSLFNQFLEVLW